MSPPLSYALLLFPQFEILDAFGPIECLNTLVHSSAFPHSNSLNFNIIAETLEPVSSGPVPGDPKPFNPRVEQKVVPTLTYQDALKTDIDVLIIPGGFGTGGAVPLTSSGFEPDTTKLVDFIRAISGRVNYIITVCTGSGLIAQAGVLDGERATTNKVAWKAITPLGPKTHWVGHARWTVTSDNKIWTSSGVSAGTDCFLAFVEQVYGVDEKTGMSWADYVSNSMEYNRVTDWKDDPFAERNGVEDVPPVS